MTRRKIHIIVGSLMLIFLGASLTLSTLHSHNHIEWYHPKQHVDTGHCLTIDSTVCPICAYLFKTDLNDEVKVEYHFNIYETVNDRSYDFPVHSYYSYLKGRSPPFSV